jgi:hypothetical protein
MKNPLFRAGGAPLVWDSDLNMEGVALKYDRDSLFASLAAFSIEERSASSDSVLLTSQPGFSWPLHETLRLKVGGGYFGYSRTRGNVAFFNGSAKGNTLDAAGNYVYDYKNIELFAEMATKLGDWPLRIFVQSVRNTAVCEQDSAFALGIKLGSAKQAGDAEFAWTFQDIEADAVIGTFNDSDFGGGGTDSKGHLIKA